MRIKPVVGTRYNFYTVISEDVGKSSDGKRTFKVKCDCGCENEVRASHLISGRSKSCKSCASKRTAKHHPPPVVFKGVGGLSKTHYSGIRLGAERRGIDFNVSIEFLWNLFIKQNGLCALSSVPIVLLPLIKNSNVDWDVITASLDRIDNSRGYEEDNVWWVHKEANRIKNNYSLNELLFWSNKFLITHGNPEPSAVKEIEVAAKVQRLTGEDSTNKPDTSAQPLVIG